MQSKLRDYFSSQSIHIPKALPALSNVLFLVIIFFAFWIVLLASFVLFELDLLRYNGDITRNFYSGIGLLLAGFLLESRLLKRVESANQTNHLKQSTLVTLSLIQFVGCLVIAFTFYRLDSFSVVWSFIVSALWCASAYYFLNSNFTIFLSGGLSAVFSIWVANQLAISEYTISWYTVQLAPLITVIALLLFSAYASLKKDYGARARQLGFAIFLVLAVAWVVPCFSEYVAVAGFMMLERQFVSVVLVGLMLVVLAPRLSLMQRVFFAFSVVLPAELLLPLWYLVLSERIASKLLQYFGVLLFAVMLIVFYYNLDISLLAKSIYLAASGILCLLGSFYLSRLKGESDA